MQSRRIKEATAIVVCVASAGGGWYELKRGAQFGNVVCTIGLIWTVSHSWLTGRWLPSKKERNMTMTQIYEAAKSGWFSHRSDAPLERVISWGSSAFFLMLTYWIVSGAWLS
jgi:hypothetical protein